MVRSIAGIQSMERAQNKGWGQWRKLKRFELRRRKDHIAYGPNITLCYGITVFYVRYLEICVSCCKSHFYRPKS